MIIHNAIGKIRTSKLILNFNNSNIQISRSMCRCLLLVLSHTGRAHAHEWMPFSCLFLSWQFFQSNIREEKINHVVRILPAAAGTSSRCPTPPPRPWSCPKDVYIFWRSDLPDITGKGHNVENRSFASIWTFNILIFCNAIGKFRTSKCLLTKNSFRCSEFTYGVTKDQNVKSLLCQ